MIIGFLLPRSRQGFFNKFKKMCICDKLPTIKSCCCRFSLRNGSIIVGWIYIIGSILNLILAGINFSKLKRNTTGDMTHIFQRKSFDKNFIIITEYDYDIMLSSLVIMTVVYVVQVALSSLLLLGASQNKQTFLLPYLWLQAINLILVFVNVIVAFIAFWGSGIAALIGWGMLLIFL